MTRLFDNSPEIRKPRRSDGEAEASGFIGAGEYGFDERGSRGEEGLVRGHHVVLEGTRGNQVSETERAETLRKHVRDRDAMLRFKMSDEELFGEPRPVAERAAR